MFDALCHLDFPELDANLASELADARACGVEGWLVPGCAPKSWEALGALSRHPGVCVAVGLHPWWVKEVLRGESLDGVIAGLRDAAVRLHAVALGECGLDALHDRPSEAEVFAQQRTFEGQLVLARELELPLVLHVVRAHGAALESLRRVGVPAAGGVVHGFTGSLELARQYLSCGLHIGVGCAVTRAETQKLKETVRALPLDRVLLETDAPDQAPRSHGPDAPRTKGTGRPRDLRLVAEAVAALRGSDVETLGKATADNARALFGR